MHRYLTHTLLNIPLYIWVLQLLYVAVALSILYVYATTHKRTTKEIVLFVVAVIIVDIIWRLAIKR